MPVLDTFNLPRQSIEPQQLPRQKLAGVLAAAISPARHGHYFFEIAAAKSRPRLFLPRQSLGPDCFCRGKVLTQIILPRQSPGTAAVLYCACVSPLVFVKC